MALLSWFLDLVRRHTAGTIPPEPEKPIGSPFRVSPSGVDFIKQFEGFMPRMYLCPAGVPTIGFGHVIKPDEDFSRGITYEEGLVLLRKDLYPVEEALRELVVVPLNIPQFDALASFTFNVGADIDEDAIPEGLGDSTLLRKLNQWDYAGAAAEFPAWVWAGGQVLPGLVRRREAERQLFERGIYARA